MTEAEKAELRALLKPGSREPTDAEYEVIAAYWREAQRRYREATSPVPGPTRSVVQPRNVVESLIRRAAELGHAIDGKCSTCGRDWGGPCPVCPREFRAMGDADGHEHGEVLFRWSPGAALVCPVCAKCSLVFERMPPAHA